MFGVCRRWLVVGCLSFVVFMVDCGFVNACCLLCVVCCLLLYVDCVLLLLSVVVGCGCVLFGKSLVGCWLLMFDVCCCVVCVVCCRCCHCGCG